MQSEHIWTTAFYSIPAIVVILLLAPKLAFGLGIDDALNFGNSTSAGLPSSEDQTELSKNAVEVFFAAKNLLGALHELDMSLVKWVAQIAHVDLPPAVVSVISIALMFVLAMLIIRFFIKSMKHASIIAMVAVAFVLLIPYAPIQR